MENFRKDLIDCLDQRKQEDFDSFSEIFESVLNGHAPKKKRTIRGNQKHLLTKTLCKAIMRQLRLKMFILYKKQLNYAANKKQRFVHC